MFDNILSVAGDEQPIKFTDIAKNGFFTANEWDSESHEFGRGSIVDVVVAGDGPTGYVIRRVVLGNLTADTWDKPPTMYLRWPSSFREEYLTVHGIKMVEQAKSTKEAAADLLQTIRDFANLTDGQLEHIKAKIDLLAALSAVDSVDWDSSSTYC